MSMNVGLLLLTHNDIGSQLLLTAKSTYGSVPMRTELLSIDYYDKPADIINLARQYVKVLDNGKGVIILTDMFGGTPSNLAISIMAEEKVEVVAGVNLPMLIKISSLRNNCEIKELIKISQEAGRKYMNVASAFFGES